MANKVFCVIVTYNAMKWVDRCLGSLRDSSQKVNTIVIDNLSKDSTVKHIKDNYPEVDVIENKINKGFGQANNQGIEKAYLSGAEYVFLLNQDAWVEKNTIQDLIKCFENTNAAVVSPIHLNGLGTSLDYGFFLAAVSDIRNCDFVSDLYLSKERDYYEAHNINAAAWMLSRKTIDEIGGFDPLFFHYGEDGNYCQRLKYHKKKMYFVKSARIYHDRNKTGNITVYKRMQTTMLLFLTHANINRPFIKFGKDDIQIHGSIFLNFFRFLFTFKLKNCWMVLQDVVTFYSKIPKIIKSRHHNKIVNSNWLNI